MEDADEDLKVLHVGYQKGQRDYHYARDTFAFYGLEYVVRGSGYFESQGQRQEITGGMVFCYGKGIPHRYGTDPDNPLEKEWVIFDGTRAGELLRESLGTMSGAVALRNPNDIHPLFAQLNAELKGGTRTARRIASHYLRIVLLKMSPARQGPGGRHVGALNTYLECKHHIDTHFADMESPFEWLSHYRVSASYLCRLFRRFAECTPYEYLTNLKMNRAAHLLLSTHLSVKQIAQEIAFSDPYNLSRVFRKRFGVSPRYFRSHEGRGG